MTVRTNCFLWSLALSIAMTAGRAAATVVLPQNFEQLESQAQLVFVGICTTRTATIDQHGTPITVFAFQIIEPVKGNLQKAQQIAVRQFGNDIPTSNGLRQWIPGLPSYPIGRKVLLFLNPPSRLGLTSPVGLFQGLFLVERDAQGREGLRLDPLRRRLLVGKANVAKYVAAKRLTPAEEAVASNPPEWVELSTFCSLVRKITQERERAESEP